MNKRLQFNFRHYAMLALLGVSVVAGCKKDDEVESPVVVKPAPEAPIIPITDKSSKFISKVFEYLPAPGQFINEEGLGDATAGKTIIGDIAHTGLVSLGGYGGYIVFGFDHSIINHDGYDFALVGNPIPPPNNWSEPGIVMVSQDVNGNGLPDDEWYELAGSEYNHPKTIHNYEITYTNPKSDTADVAWKDNQGNTGAVEQNMFHAHSYYPSFAPNQNTLTFKGTLLRSTWNVSEDTGYFLNDPFAWGYVDNWSSGDDYNTTNYNSFDISSAVDKDGIRIKLKAIDFVKVYTGQNEKGNRMLGEISTEVSGGLDLNLSKGLNTNTKK